MKKDFMNSALLEHPNSPLAKLIVSAWNKFKEWWEKNKKPQVQEKAKASVIKQLKELKDKAEKQGTDNKRDAIDKGIKWYNVRYKKLILK